MPSHVDIEDNVYRGGIEENEQADGLAKEGVKKHGVKLVKESRKAGRHPQKRDREEREKRRSQWK